MNTTKRLLAAAQLLLMFPSVLFMGALVIRKLQPLQEEPARTAQRIVMWYSARMWTLWALLIALPLAALLTGCFTLLRTGSKDRAVLQAVQPTIAVIRAHRTMKFVAATTAMAGAVLVIVVMHMLAN